MHYYPHSCNISLSGRKYAWSRRVFVPVFRDISKYDISNCNGALRSHFTANWRNPRKLQVKAFLKNKKIPENYRFLLIASTIVQLTLLLVQELLFLYDFIIENLLHDFGSISAFLSTVPIYFLFTDKDVFFLIAQNGLFSMSSYISLAIVFERFSRFFEISFFYFVFQSLRCLACCRLWGEWAESSSTYCPNHHVFSIRNANTLSRAHSYVFFVFLTFILNALFPEGLEFEPILILYAVEGMTFIVRILSPLSNILPSIIPSFFLEVFSLLSRFRYS